MIKIFLLLFILAGQLCLNAQTKLQVVQDSVRVANGELILRNASRNVQGMLYNKGNGTTEFRKIKLQNANDSVSIVIGSDSVNFSLQGNGAGSVYNTDPDVLLSRTAISSTQMKLKWWKSSNDLYQSPRIGIIGDSQGEGLIPSTYAQSIMGRLQQFIYGVANNAGIINYCKTGYNSRKLSPTGSNAFVDNDRNITKALADGNKIIVLCNTSNDFSSAAAGGYTTISEYMTNTLSIADACDKAGATLFVISPFPRNEYTAAVRDSMRVLASMLNQKFNSRFVYAYHLLEDPAQANTLMASLQVGDGIHLNDEGSRIVFEALREVLVSYYTSNTQVKNYQVQRSASYTGSYTTVATVATPNTPEWQVAADSSFYKVRIAYRSGYYSKWSNIIQGTKARPDTVYSLPPLVTSISPVIIYLPRDSTTISVSASDPNIGGSISSYSWTKVQGGAFTISNAAVAKPLITGLQEGTYVFRCEVKNNINLVSYADVQLIVRVYESSLAVSRFNFNYAPQNISGWIDVSGGPFTANTNGNVWTDNINNRSLVSLGTSNVIWGPDWYNNAGNTNGESVPDAGGYLIPSSVMHSGWYSNGRVYTADSSNQLKFTNLSPAKTYRIKFYGSLGTSLGLDADPTVYIVNNNVLNQKEVNAVGNTSAVVVFRNVVPSAQGEIKLFAGSAQGRSQFGMLNGLTIEEDTLSPVNIVPQVTGVNRTITYPMDATTLSASATDADGAIVTVAWTKISGPTGAVIESANSMKTPVTFTTAGTYVFRCSVTDDRGGVGTADVQVQFNGASSNPSLYVGVGPNAYTQSGWTVMSGSPHASIASATATLSGSTVTINTVSTSNWASLFGAATADTTGERIDDGGGFLAQPNVQRGAFFNVNGYDVAKPQVELTGLPAGTYKVTMMGSLKTSVAEFLYANCETEFRVSGSSSVITINTKGNTSHPAVFENITVGSGGSLKLYFNPIIASSNNYIGMLNFFIVEKTN